MTRDEASDAIDKLEFPTMKAGLQKLKIVAIEDAVNKVGEWIKDGNGNPAIKITFENREGEKISDNFYYPNGGNICKSAFKLAGLRKAMGLDYMTPLSHEAVQAKKYYVWAVIVEEHLMTAAGQPVTKNGVPSIFNKLDKRYYSGAEKPKIEGDPLDPAFKGEIGATFIAYRVDTSATAPRAAAKQDNSEFDDVPAPQAVTAHAGPMDEDAF